MTHDVFISYSHKDKLIADSLCANLETAGVRCWYAPRDIGPGEDWPTAISEAIPQGRVMVMVFSSDSNASVQVYRELFVAASSNVIIIPFKIEDVEPEARKGFILAGMHWLDAMNPPTQEQIDLLVRSVKSFLASPEMIKPVIATPVVEQPPAQPAMPEPVLATPDVKQSPVRPSRPRPARKIPVWVWGLFFTILILAAGAAFFTWWGTTHPSVPVPSPVPSLTFTPEISAALPTLSPQAVRAQTFAEPILAVVTKSASTFQDDFSTVNPVWKFGGPQGFSSAIEDGVARLRVNQVGGFMSESTYLVKRDFVLQFDARLVSGDATSKIMVTIGSYPETQQLVLELYPAVQQWDISSDWPGSSGIGSTQSGAGAAVSPLGGTTQMTIIIRDARFALYLNNTPISLIDDNYINSGLTGNGSRRVFIHCESDSAAVCEFDNLKFWDLATIPGLP